MATTFIILHLREVGDDRLARKGERTMVNLSLAQEIRQGVGGHSEIRWGSADNFSRTHIWESQDEILAGLGYVSPEQRKEALAQIVAEAALAAGPIPGGAS